MNDIDQHIRIPTSPDTIWGLISDLENNPRWQVNCQSITFLSQRKQGTGTRWRQYNTNGKEHVKEVVAWYEGLGYEYVFVDGSPYKSCKGRLRLRETAEGTILQWTFSYEVGGLFGGLRDSLSLKRSLDNEMEKSLQMLYTLVTEIAPRGGYTSAALMQAAPDVEGRATYRPRHTPITPPPMPAVDAEAPIAEDDTRPRPAVTEADTLPEPDFLSRFAPPPGHTPTFPDPDPPTREREREEVPSMPSFPAMDEIAARTAEPAPYTPADPTEERPTREDIPAFPRVDEIDEIAPASEPQVTPDPMDAATEAHIEDETFDRLAAEEPPHVTNLAETPARGQPAAETVPEPDPVLHDDLPTFAKLLGTDEPEVVLPPLADEPEETETEAAPVSDERLEAMLEEPEIPADATGEKTIWEVFGVPRPSETQQMRAVSIETQEHPQVDLPEPPTATQEHPTVEQVVAATPEQPAESGDSEALAGSRDVTPGRIGLRVLQRRRLVRLRRPK